MIDPKTADTIGHFFINTLTVTIPIALYIWNNKRNAKADVQKRHEENQKVLTELAKREEFFPSHGHIERAGPLCAEGITRPPNEK